MMNKQAISIIKYPEILDIPFNGFYPLNSSFKFFLYYINIAMGGIYLIKGFEKYKNDSEEQENCDIWLGGVKELNGSPLLNGIHYIKVQKLENDILVELTNKDSGLTFKCEWVSVYKSFQNLKNFYPYLDPVPMPAYQDFPEYLYKKLAEIDKAIARCEKFKGNDPLNLYELYSISHEEILEKLQFQEKLKYFKDKYNSFLIK